MMSTTGSYAPVTKRTVRPRATERSALSRRCGLSANSWIDTSYAGSATPPEYDVSSLLASEATATPFLFGCSIRLRSSVDRHGTKIRGGCGYPARSRVRLATARRAFASAAEVTITGISTSADQWAGDLAALGGQQFPRTRTPARTREMEPDRAVPYARIGRWTFPCVPLPMTT
jgi:hypothetical protein